MAARASCDICGSPLPVPAVARLSKLRPLVPFGTKGDDAERQLARLGRGKIGDMLGMSENDARAADGKRVVDLRRRIAVIERRQNEPGLEAGEIWAMSAMRFGINDAKRSPGFSPSAR